jgi:hypothetical protein
MDRWLRIKRKKEGGVNKFGGYNAKIIEDRGDTLLVEIERYCKGATKTIQVEIIKEV